ncbi:MAG: DUF5606 domain-containing protein [Bacteroidales bacterium]|nr:DUF5606 domain-containing protein [Bacteroidales bacterium]
MELKEILSIAGKPGLFKNIGQSKTGVIVESINDGKRFPAFAHERISSLAEISVFTQEDDVPLADVFKKIFEKYEGKEAIDAKSGSNDLRAFMKEILPNYDEERVYTSDIKKLITWYNLLVAKNLLEFTESVEEVKAESTESPEEKEENTSPEEPSVAE